VPLVDEATNNGAVLHLRSPPSNQTHQHTSEVIPHPWKHNPNDILTLLFTNLECLSFPDMSTPALERVRMSF